MPGVRFVPRRFVPTASKFAGETCQGVDIIVTDRDAFQPVPAGLTIATVLRQLYSDRWQVAGMERLLLNRQVLGAIMAGQTYQDIRELYAQQEQEFMKRRDEHLLY
jgi:uncharacterized protein YbbC (DUF1343 family)